MVRPAEKKEMRIIAKERVKILFDNAEEMFRRDSKLSDRYVALARKIAMKANMRMPRELKRRFCKHCNSYLKPGVNCRIRTNEGKVVYYCLNCKKFMRYPYLKEKKERRL